MSLALSNKIAGAKWLKTNWLRGDQAAAKDAPKEKSGPNFVDRFLPSNSKLRAMASSALKATLLTGPTALAATGAVAMGMPGVGLGVCLVMTPLILRELLLRPTF